MPQTSVNNCQAHCNGFFFVIIAEGPVSQHLEKGVVGIVASNFIQVIVLTGYTQAFLRIRLPGCTADGRYPGKHP